MSFALYLDENIDSLLAQMLQRLGHDVLTTQQAGQRGASDNDQIAFAAGTLRAIVTYDRRDYRRLATEWAESAQPHSGIVVASGGTPQQLRTWILDMFDLYPDGIANLYLTLPLTQ